MAVGPKPRLTVQCTSRRALNRPRRLLRDPAERGVPEGTIEGAWPALPVVRPRGIKGTPRGRFIYRIALVRVGSCNVVVPRNQPPQFWHSNNQ